MSKLKTIEAYDNDGDKMTAIMPADKGRKPKYHLLHYENCKLGNASFIITGKRPCCAWCGDKSLIECVKISQPDLFGVVNYFLVAQCNNCSQLTVFRYSIGG